MDRAELSLGDDPAVRVEQRGRAVARLADDRRVGRADQLLAHLLRDRRPVPG